MKPPGAEKAVATDWRLNAPLAGSRPPAFGLSAGSRWGVGSTVSAAPASLGAAHLPRGDPLRYHAQRLGGVLPGCIRWAGAAGYFLGERGQHFGFRTAVRCGFSEEGADFIENGFAVHAASS